jgi:cytochrome c biogenesis protein CcdA
MGQALGSLLPLGVAAAVSTVPILVTILILLSENRNRSALAYLIGWVAGTLVLVTVGTVAASSLPEPRPRQPDTIVGALEILLGVGMVSLGILAFRRRQERASGQEPKWAHAVGAFGAGRSLGLGLALNLRPKSVLLCAAAGLALDSANDGVEVTAVLVVVYTVIATSTVAVPIIATLISPTRMEPRLVDARKRLDDNGRLVSGAMMVMIGMLLVTVGITHL